MKQTHDPEIERATIAAALQSGIARKLARRHLEAADFYEPAHERIWHAMAELDRAKQPVDHAVIHAHVAGSDRIAITAQAVVLDLIGHHALPDYIESYAEEVRGWAIRRRLYAAATRVQQAAENPDTDPSGLASAVASRFAQVRDSGLTEDAKSITFDELLATPDDEPDWVVPGFLERGDRFILTGGEGLGKSYLLRQVAIMAAAGLDPFDSSTRITPRKVLIVDCENSLRQIKRKARGVVEFARRHGSGNPGQVNLVACGRIDLLRDKDLAMIHREIDAVQPDIIVIGPIYAMSPKALMTDDDAVPVLAALDTMRERGAALLMEAHAGHANGPDGRNFRPRGSAALMGWPEFGYGMKPVSSGYADLVPWRGDRDARNWPQALRHDNQGLRWIEHDGTGHAIQTDSVWNTTRGIA